MHGSCIRATWHDSFMYIARQNLYYNRGATDSCSFLRPIYTHGSCICVTWHDSFMCISQKFVNNSRGKWLLFRCDTHLHVWQHQSCLTLCISQQVVWKSRGACLRRLSVGNSPKLNRFVLNASMFVGIYTVYTHMFVCVNIEISTCETEQDLSKIEQVWKKKCASSQSVSP